MEFCPDPDRKLSADLYDIFILVINQLDAQNLFSYKFISCLYMFRAQVLIVRRAKLYYIASGITTLKQVSGLKLLKQLKYNSISVKT